MAHVVADRIEFSVADLLPLDGQLLDVVGANLPYIPTDALDRLPVAASFEPRWRARRWPGRARPDPALVERLPRVLRADGVALLEIGSDQADAVTALVAERLPGWTCEVLPDLAGLPRVARIEPAQPEPAR